MPDLSRLLDALDADAPLPQRHLALIALLAWIRGHGGAANTPEAALGRLRLLLDALDSQPVRRERLRAWWQALADTLDATTLLADFGLGAKLALASELAERLRQKLLPATPETRDAAELFALSLPGAADAAWIERLDAPTLGRLAALLALPSPLAGQSLWRHSVLEAIDHGLSQVRAAGLSAELRLRMDAAALQARSFQEVSRAAEAFRAAFNRMPQDAAALEAAAERLREQLDACRQAAYSVYPHLTEHGVSIGLVFQLRQLRERLSRVRELMDCLLADQPAAAAARLLALLARQGQQRRSLRALLSTSASMLAARVTERSAEAGEHYITRNPAEYRHMLTQAAGGGLVTAGTVWGKFLLGTLALSAFWGGVWASALYAASFVLIQLMHWTLATKQPAMTAPAMAAKLRELGDARQVEEFVDEVAHLVRSQVAAVLGNVGLVAPCVAVLALAWQGAVGSPLLTPQEARQVLDSLDVRNPWTLLFAAFTGVLLFVSSLIAGWAENAFVLHRLHSALRYNPRITAALGAARANRWAHFMREHISGLAGNISLGFLLGLLPALLAFVGLALQARHVTLSAGQLTAAAVTLGAEVWRMPQFYACLLAIPLIGALNLGVSFYFALRLALRAHSVSGVDRTRIRRVLWARWRRRPGSFLLPV